MTGEKVIPEVFEVPKVFVNDYSLAWQKLDKYPADQDAIRTMRLLYAICALEQQLAAIKSLLRWCRLNIHWIPELGADMARQIDAALAPPAGEHEDVKP